MKEGFAMFLLKKRFCMFSFLILMLVVAIIISGCGGLLGLNAEQNPSLNQVTLAGIDSICKINVPFGLTMSEPVDVPQNLRAYVKGQKSYQGNNKIMNVLISTCTYDMKSLPKEFKPNLKGAADGSINGISNTLGVKNFTATKSNITVSGKPAILATILYDKNKVKFERKILFFVDQDYLWMADVMYISGDKTAQKIASEILQSFAISN